MPTKNAIPPVKGMRDLYPEQLALRNYIYSRVRQASELFGYQEWEGPYVETIDLYAAKSGEELVEKQSFVFKDRGGESIILRPELTPSLTRMVAKRQNELVFPLRWWQFGPFWRYEQPQRGRTREFYQWNIDMLGASSPEADAELIAIAATFLKLVGLKADQTRIYVNDRRLMNAEFEALDIKPEKRMQAAGLIDKRPKMSPESWEAYALELDFDQSQLDGIKRLLGNGQLWQADANLLRLFRALDALGVGDYVEFNPSIMRGLLYYTGTVFEVFDTTGSVRRSLFGGGRYDNLLSDVGGEPLPAVGFAMGDVGMGLLLQEKGLVPAFQASPASILMTVFDEALWKDCYAFAAGLRAQGLAVATYPEPTKLQKQLKYADRLGMPVAIVLGPDEAAAGNVTLKDLRSGRQTTVRQTDAAGLLREMIGLDR